MLIIITSQTDVKNEADIINNLFEAGMQLLHIRKPNAGASEIEKLIKKINPQFYHQLALHQHHWMANDFAIVRLHYKEEVRKEIDQDELAVLQTKYILSTSIHAIEDYDKLSLSFEYTFLGPVFNSISKPGYKAEFADCLLPQHNEGPEIIAIGGIDVNNIEKAKELKFDGVAVLGAIWQKPEESIKQFKLLQQAWKVAGR